MPFRKGQLPGCSLDLELREPPTAAELIVTVPIMRLVCDLRAAWSGDAEGGVGMSVNRDWYLLWQTTDGDACDWERHWGWDTEDWELGGTINLSYPIPVGGFPTRSCGGEKYSCQAGNSELQYLHFTQTGTTPACYAGYGNNHVRRASRH